MAMFYKFFDGISLSQYILYNHVTASDFLKIGLNIISTLKSVHATGIKHLRINSNNILINHATLETEIIDFSMATHSSENIILNFNDWGDELAYIAPEQTGHFNKTTDLRTDFYSFGIVLYELWCGQTPFSETGTSEIIHSHLVKTPPDLKIVKPDTPVFSSGVCAVR